MAAVGDKGEVGAVGEVLDDGLEVVVDDDVEVGGADGLVLAVRLKHLVRRDLRAVAAEMEHKDITGARPSHEVGQLLLKDLARGEVLVGGAGLINEDLDVLILEAEELRQQLPHALHVVDAASELGVGPGVVAPDEEGLAHRTLRPRWGGAELSNRRGLAQPAHPGNSNIASAATHAGNGTHSIAHGTLCLTHHALCATHGSAHGTLCRPHRTTHRTTHRTLGLTHHALCAAHCASHRALSLAHHSLSLPCEAALVATTT
mmetsp:Transcript_29439/g.63546  ORF Transcript_29439/g.63546 Transcript_29439/m.63546 type:complete len:260 (+) Transcript_29439:949-1728(+)